MKISIKTNHFTPADTKEDAKVELKGYATIRFDDKYVLDNVRILENKEKNTLFVALPTIKTKDGEHKEFFHPITADTRNALNKAVLGQFNSAELEQNEFYAYQLGDKVTFEPSARAKDFFDYTKDNIIGIGSVKFGYDWVCENIQVKEKKDGSGVYIDTPSRKVEKTGEYNQMFYPITPEAAAEFKQVCVNALDEFKKEKAKAADWGIPVKEERTDAQPAVENEQGVDNSISFDDSEFEDLDLSASNSRGR